MAGRTSQGGLLLAIGLLGLQPAFAAPAADFVEVGARTEARVAARQTDAWLQDAAITTEVKALLITDRRIDGERINVDTRAGQVTLYGTVADPTTVRRAVQLAKSVDGVEAVDSRLRTLNP